MSYTVTRDHILSVAADAAVISVENAMVVSIGPSNEALREAGGQDLAAALNAKRFIPVGSAAALEAGSLPFQKILVTSTPRWWNGECNELLVLDRCYTAVFSLAKELGCRSVVMPFLSTAYYRFPLEDAVKIAQIQAVQTDLAVTLIAETEELFTLGTREYRKPNIVSYVGFYRDHGVFELDNGMFARVDVRPEKKAVEVRAFVEACYRFNYDPEQLPLSEQEIDRLRAIYEESEGGIL